MISFDVVSLFPCIPLDTDKTSQMIYLRTIAHDKLDKHYTKTTYWTSLTSTFTLHEISFQNNYYRQISGTCINGFSFVQFSAKAVNMKDLAKSSDTKQKLTLRLGQAGTVEDR